MPIWGLRPCQGFPTIREVSGYIVLIMEESINNRHEVQVFFSDPDQCPDDRCTRSPGPCVYGIKPIIFLHIPQPMSEEVCPALVCYSPPGGDSHHVQVLLPVVEKVTVDPEILRLLVPDLPDGNHIKTVDLCIGIGEENR